MKVILADFVQLSSDHHCQSPLILCKLQHLLCFSMFAVSCKEKHVIQVLQAPRAADWDVLWIPPAVKRSGLHLSPRHIECNPFFISTEPALLLIRPRHEVLYGYKQLIDFSDMHWFSAFIVFYIPSLLHQF